MTDKPSEISRIRSQQARRQYREGGRWAKRPTVIVATARPIPPATTAPATPVPADHERFMAALHQSFDVTQRGVTIGLAHTLNAFDAETGRVLREGAQRLDGIHVDLDRSLAGLQRELIALSYVTLPGGVDG